MKIGITKPRGWTAQDFLLQSKEIFKIDLSEWDILDVLDISMRKRTQIRRRIISSGHQVALGLPSSFLFSNPEITLERIAITEEVAESINAQFMILRLNSTRLTPENSLRWIAESEKEIWIDEGRNKLSTAPSQLVTDPLWYMPRAKARIGGVFKLHGWHPSRWIRYYGTEQLLALKRVVTKARPRAVLFAHSMRNEEAYRFRELLNPSGDTLG
ncbi:MAG: hypothetical protein KGQ59_06575 [Bdellovibrionales bacterium]|nr:hypothetical protein [Bdellovibrionales bacterium]